MEPEENTTETQQLSSLHTVTPLSKYLAIVLFVVLPFFGGYIGYVYAPEKVVEVDKVVAVDREQQTPEKAASETQPIADVNQVVTTFPDLEPGYFQSPKRKTAN